MSHFVKLFCNWMLQVIFFPFLNIFTPIANKLKDFRMKIVNIIVIHQPQYYINFFKDVFLLAKYKIIHFFI